jgi:hypothetical protein
MRGGKVDMHVIQILESLVLETTTRGNAIGSGQFTRGLTIRKEFMDSLGSPASILAAWHNLAIPNKKSYDIKCAITVHGELHIGVSYHAPRKA